MEAVIFDGKEYLKASVVAERFNYTQDYIGQLCRGKKVDARLVGRAWYINLESLESHRSGRYKGPVKEVSVQKGAVPATLQQSRGNYLSRIDVEPVLKKKTVKILQNKGGTLNELSVKYENDDYSLIPSVSREAVHKPIPVLPAEAEEMKVKATKESVRVTSFKAESLPEVYLKGVLKVDGIPEATEEELASLQMEQIPAEISPENHIENYQKRDFVAKNTHFQSDGLVKKPLKIKLYRNSQAFTPATHPRGILKVSPKQVERQIVDAKIPERPGARSRAEQQQTVARSIVVNNAEFHPTSVTNRVGAHNTPLPVPFATTKAVLILLTCLSLSLVLLTLELETVVRENSMLRVWAFSTDTATKISTILK